MSAYASALQKGSRQIFRDDLSRTPSLYAIATPVDAPTIQRVLRRTHGNPYDGDLPVPVQGRAFWFYRIPAPFWPTPQVNQWVSLKFVVEDTGAWVQLLTEDYRWIGLSTAYYTKSSRGKETLLAVERTAIFPHDTFRLLHLFTYQNALAPYFIESHRRVSAIDIPAVQAFFNTAQEKDRLTFINGNWVASLDSLKENDTVDVVVTSIDKKETVEPDTLASIEEMGETYAFSYSPSETVAWPLHSAWVAHLGNQEGRMFYPQWATQLRMRGAGSWALSHTLLNELEGTLRGAFPNRDTEPFFITRYTRFPYLPISPPFGGDYFEEAEDLDDPVSALVDSTHPLSFVGKPNYHDVAVLPESLITEEKGLRSLGYFPSGKLLIGEPVPTVRSADARIAPVPEALAGACTAYEYLQNGKMVYWQVHTRKSPYVCRFSGTNRVEFLPGIGSENLEVFRSDDPVTLRPGVAARAYSATFTQDTQTSAWEPLAINGPVLTPASGTRVMVRYDDVFLINEFMFTQQRGELAFEMIENTAALENGPRTRIPLDIAGNSIAVFLNGFRLVRDLEYAVVFPFIVLLTRDRFVGASVETANQQLHVRVQGTAATEFAFPPPMAVGAVEYGTLGYGVPRILSEDKAIVATVNSALYPTFIRTNQKTLTVKTNLNGAFYEVQAPYLPLCGWVPESFRDDAVETDTAVREILPPLTYPDDPSNFSIVNRVFCPFFTQWIKELQDGTYTDEALGTLDILVLASTNAYWAISPLNANYPAAPQYVEVGLHPYTGVISLGTPQRLVFLESMVETLAPGRVVATQYVSA